MFYFTLYNFDYWNPPLNMRMPICYVDYHETGLCCYLVISIENLLRPLQLFHFHLGPIYRLSLVAGWRNLQNEELHNLYSSPNVIKIINSRGMRREEHIVLMWQKRNTKLWWESHKRPPEKPTRRWEDNTKMDCREIRWVGMDLIHQLQDRDQWMALVDTVMKLFVL
jgi:hypothetical protein